MATESSLRALLHLNQMHKATLQDQILQAESFFEAWAA